MNNMTEQQSMGHMLHAAAHLLTGTAGQHPNLDNRSMLIFGPEPNFPTLLHWGDWVRRSGVPILSLHFAEPNVPVLAMVVEQGGEMLIFERCFFWMRNERSSVQIVPDGFKYGAYVFDGDRRLKRLGRAPASTFEAARDGIVRACNRFADIAIAQREAGFDPALPQLMERKAA